MEETNLKDEIKKLNENFQQLVEKKEVKKFKLPRSGKLSKGKTKQGYASICYIGENKEVSFLKAPVKEGAILVNGTPHVATAEYMLTHKSKPFLIVPAWNIKPFSAERDADQATRDKNTTVGYAWILNKLKSEQLKTKKQMSIGIMLLIGAAIIGVIYYFSRSGGGAAG